MISRKLLAGICIIALLVSMASTYTGLQVFGQAGSTLTTNTLTGGVNSGAPTYTIFIDGGYYHAKDAYGAIYDSSTDIADLIETVANSTANGGLIFVKAGNYTVHKGELRGGTTFGVGCKITRDNIVIQGEGNSTVFVSSGAQQRIFTFTYAENCALRDLVLDGLNLDIQQSPDAADGLVVFDTGADYGLVQNCVLRNGLNADGGGSFQSPYVVFKNNIVHGNEHGLVLTECIGGRIEDNHIFDCDTNGALISANNMTWTYNDYIVNNIIENVALNGIEVSTNASYNTIIGNSISDCNRGIFIGTSFNTVTGNTAKGNTNDAILIGYTGIIATNNIVTSNFALFSTDVTNGYGVREWSGSNHNMFSLNWISGNAAGTIQTSGANTNSTNNMIT